jgi:hypothetical protein
MGLAADHAALIAELQDVKAANVRLQTLADQHSRLQATLAAAGVNEMVDAAQRLEAYEAGVRAAIEVAEQASREVIVRIDAEADLLRQELLEIDAAGEMRKIEIAHEERRLHEEMASLESVVVNLRDTVVLQDAGLFDFEHAAENSLELKSKLDALRGQIKSEVRSKEAISFDPTSFSFNNSKTEGAKFVKEFATLMLRAYNSEAENCVKSVRAGNLTAAQARLDRARSTISKLGQRMQIEVGTRYHGMRMEELQLAARYQIAVQARKEAEREERARLREEEKVLRELEAARAKLDKERAQYAKALEQLALQPGADLSELENRLAQIDLDIANVEFRRANTRAGHVYIISNVGAFGERMVKIGMTRRQEPDDRVKELGDASVPFAFDKHALIFSKDAVGLEAALHREFAHVRVNRINLRREFFYATPIEVRDALVRHDGHLLDFVEYPEAEEFRLSQAIFEQESRVLSAVA